MLFLACVDQGQLSKDEGIDGSTICTSDEDDDWQQDSIYISIPRLQNTPTAEGGSMQIGIASR
jgi:hypothetical protein